MQKFINMLEQRRWLRDRYSGLVIEYCKMQYFAIPKVACSSIMAGLVRAIGVNFPDDEWSPELFQTNKWDHLYDRRSHVLSKRRALAASGRWRFAFVRNPFDRLVSCYSEKIRPNGDPENFVGGMSNVLHPFGVFHRDMSFEEFARAACAIPDTKADPHWRSQYTFLINGRGQIAMNFVGRFERLSKDLEQVKLHCASDIAVPHLLKSERASYRDYYSNSLRELVAERYAKDLHCFGYAFT